MTGNDKPLAIVTYEVNGGQRVFAVRYTESKAYNALCTKLLESSFQVLYSDDHEMIWYFKNWKDEESFMAISEWFEVKEAEWLAQ